MPGRPLKGVIDGDGDTLNDETGAALRSIARYAARESTRVPWMQNDVLVIDNRTVMHSRDAFVPPRRILVTLLGCIDNPAREARDRTREETTLQQRTT